MIVIEGIKENGEFFLIVIILRFGEVLGIILVVVFVELLVVEVIIRSF